MSDSEQCLNRLELYLISPLVNFSCELGQIMTRYDFLYGLDESFSMINFLIAFKFWCSLTRRIYMLGEYVIYGQIRAIKGKYNQIGANKAKCG